jgi:hypothetical protein
MTGPEYKKTSTAVLILAIAGLTLPLLFPLISTARPFTQCASLTLFNNPCPMCGLTRGFFSIWKLDLHAATEFNILSLPLFAAFLIQAVFRAWVVLKIDSKPQLLALAKPDMVLHMGLIAGYFVYACGFVLLKWNWTL